MPPPNVDAERALQALGDVTRRRMVEALGRGPLSVSALAEPFAMTLAGVNQHVQVLQESGLVTSQKVGRVRTCSLNPKALEALAQWVSDRRSTWDKRLDRLTDLIENPPRD